MYISKEFDINKRYDDVDQLFEAVPTCIICNKQFSYVRLYCEDCELSIDYGFEYKDFGNYEKIYISAIILKTKHFLITISPLIEDVKFSHNIGKRTSVSYPPSKLELVVSLAKTNSLDEHLQKLALLI